MEWKLNSQEWDALFDLRAEDVKLYVLGIRPYMDYATGLVGVKRKISYQSLTEVLNIPAEHGRAEESFTKRQIQRSIERLEKSGLISRIEKNFVKIKLNLASTDKSVSDKLVHSRYGSGDVSGYDKKEQNNIIKQDTCVNGDSEVGTDVGTANSEKLVTPPVSGINNINIINRGGTRASRSPSQPLPTDFQIKDSHKKLAAELSMDDAWLKLEFGNFCDHFWENQKKGKNWDLAFNRWIRRSKSYNQNKTKQGASNGKSGKRDWYFDNIAEKVRAAGY